MAQITKPNDFQPNTTIASSEVNDNFDTIYSEFNGNISSTNLADNAVTTAKIADDAVTAAKIADGTITAAQLSSETSQGYYDLGDVPDTVTYNGNRSYDLVFNSNDLTDTVSEGMRVKITRTVTPPTQCTDLESGSSQYWSRTSANLGSTTTFTDDFCTGAWIKLESYTAGVIISRYNGTSGWVMDVLSTGQVRLHGYNGGAGNYSGITSYQSIPLNKWVHVAAQLDMSAFTATTTTSYIMIDGVDVPAVVARAGTNPTALVQAGDLQVGAANSTSYFDGKIAQAWYSNAKITQSNIKTFISQGMTGSETSIVSHYDFNGDANDNNANGNNLSANGGAGYSTDSPFNATEYGIITAKAFSTNTTLTVQVPEGYAIPTSGGVSAVSYSTQDVPYGFPRDKGKWCVEALYRTDNTQNTPVNGTWYNLGSAKLNAPIGAWNAGYTATFFAIKTTSTTMDARISLSTSSSAVSDTKLSGRVYAEAAATNTTALGTVTKDTALQLAAATDYYLIFSSATGSATSITFQGLDQTGWIRFELAYV